MICQKCYRPAAVYLPHFHVCDNGVDKKYCQCGYCRLWIARIKIRRVIAWKFWVVNGKAVKKR